jgi:O-antigen/teichoic acid export membrane protein
MTTIPSVLRREPASFLSAGVRRLAGSLSVTLLGQGVLLCGLFLMTRVSASAFGAVGFGEYQVARRTLAVVAFPLMCGLGVSMPRYIARDIGDRREVATWLISGGLASAALIGLFLGLGLWWRAAIGRWTFGDSSRQGLVLALLMAVVGMFCNTLALSVMRGLSCFRLAAVLQVAFGAMAPLAGVLLASGRVERALNIAAVLWIAIACVVFIQVWREWAIPGLSGPELYRAARALLAFGAPRVPGEIALFGIFALPAYAAVHRDDIAAAGFLSVGLSFVQAIATVFASAGFVLLPYWSQAARSSEALLVARKRIGMLVAASGLLATLGLLLLQLFMHAIARLLLGPLAEAGIRDIRFATLGAVPYVIYLVLRDYFDAVSMFPRNTVALTAAIAIQAILLSGRRLSVSAATAASFWALGLLMAALWAASMRPSAAEN